MLLRFPVELQEIIIGYCEIEDIQNLLYCCSEYYNAFLSFYWHSVTITYEQLLKVNLRNSNKLKRLRNMTKKLCITTDGYIWRYSKPFHIKKVCSNFTKVLRYCCVESLETDYLTKNAFIEIGRLHSLVELKIACDHMADGNKSVYFDNNKLQLICKQLVGLKILIINTPAERYDITDDGLINVGEFLSLEVLALCHIQMTDIGLSYISSQDTLKKLHVLQYKIDVGLSIISNLIGLQELCICESYITDQQIANIINLVNLEKLSLGAAKITDIGLEYISVLKMLNLLDLAGCKCITDRGLHHLSVLPRLRVINLMWCRNITGKGLQNLTLLEELWITSCDLVDDDLSYFKKLTLLQKLDIEGNSITNAAMIFLTHLTGLRMLLLGGTEVTETGVSKLSSLTNLKQVELNESYCMYHPDNWKKITYG